MSSASLGMKQESRIPDCSISKHGRKSTRLSRAIIHAFASLGIYRIKQACPTFRHISYKTGVSYSAARRSVPFVRLLLLMDTMGTSIVTLCRITRNRRLHLPPSFHPLSLDVDRTPRPAISFHLFDSHHQQTHLFRRCGFIRGFVVSHLQKSRKPQRDSSRVDLVSAMLPHNHPPQPFLGARSGSSTHESMSGRVHRRQTQIRRQHLPNDFRLKPDVWLRSTNFQITACHLNLERLELVVKG